MKENKGEKEKYPWGWEPWKVRKLSEFPPGTVYEGGENAATIVAGEFHIATLIGTGKQVEERAERIVTCVNYCAGIPIEKIKAALVVDGHEKDLA